MSRQTDMEFVYDRKGITRLPKNIPGERTGCALRYKTYASLCLILGSAFLVSSEQNLKFHFVVIPCIILLLFLIEVVNRFCHVLEDRGYLYARYNNSINNLVMDAFNFNKISFLTIFVSILVPVIISVIDKKFPITIYSNWDLLALVLTFGAILLIHPIFELNDCPLNDSLKIKEMKGLDYGSGMAYGFFYGYLKIVLPPSGKANSGLKHLMEVYKSNNGDINFIFYKLYILVPLSLNCPESLASGFSPSVLPATTLESIIKDRAGVKDRVYKNSVYKILVEKRDKPIYVCAEYATPLKTFEEFIKSNTPHSNICKKHKNDIIWQFYTTTMRLIKEDASTKDVCELIFYDDKDGEDFVDVGNIIVKKLIMEKKQLDKKNKKVPITDERKKD